MASKQRRRNLKITPLCKPELLAGCCLLTRKVSEVHSLQPPRNVVAHSNWLSRCCIASYICTYPATAQLVSLLSLSLSSSSSSSNTGFLDQFIFYPFVEAVDMAGTLESNCAAGRLCENVARMECGNCHLLKYCSKECQKAHWPEHRPDCRSDLLKESWQPGWAREGRKPAFMDSGIAPFVSFGRNKYLWGNIPAVDILQLKANEGEGYEGPLGLLFAGKIPLLSLFLDTEG